MVNYMNITDHGVMQGLKEWFTETSPAVLRLHLSHNDLDGYACHVISRTTLSLINNNSRSNIDWWNTPAGEENINRTITTYISKMSNIILRHHKKYLKGKTTLFILITDLGKFNPSFINSLIADGHKIRYVYIDHHVLTTDYNTIELTRNTLESQKVENAYFTCIDYCATRFLTEAAMSIYRQLIDDSPETKRVYDALIKYSNDVDSFDRGLWGKWNIITEDNAEYFAIHNPVDSISPSVTAQLLFNGFDGPEKYKYVALMANYFHSLAIPTSENLPFWYVTEEAFATKYHEIVSREYNILMDEFKKYKAEIHVLTSDIVINIPESVSNSVDHPLYIWEIYLGENEVLKYFTLISKELLEQNRDIDIIVLVCMPRHTIDMRTLSDDINLAEIAAFNGGGGHQKAAGFPMHEETEK